MFACVLLLPTLTGALAFGADPAPTAHVYKTVAGRDLLAHVFLPAGPTAPAKARPALALFHGGGWVFGKPEEFFPACARFAARGTVAVSFQYRLSRLPDGSYPDPAVSLVECVLDARSALRWLRAHAADFGIDPARIVSGGQSAGGQLALSTALCDDLNEATDDLTVSPMPAALLLFSSNVNTVEAWADFLMGPRRTEIWTVSPYHNLRSGLPPMLAFHGEEDDQVPLYIIQFFQARMKALGNVYELTTFPGRRHYLGDPAHPLGRYFDEAILDRTDAFLARHGLAP